MSSVSTRLDYIIYVDTEQWALCRHILTRLISSTAGNEFCVDTFWLRHLCRHEKFRELQKANFGKIIILGTNNSFACNIFEILRLLARGILVCKLICNSELSQSDQVESIRSSRFDWKWFPGEILSCLDLNWVQIGPKMAIFADNLIESIRSSWSDWVDPIGNGFLVKF